MFKKSMDNIEKNLISNDTSRCNNQECELKETCARFRQIEIDISDLLSVSVGVSYTKFEPINGICNFKINI
jgi:hypothetical protein